jgi:uncharacterized protein YbjQ (UPF0145 family)
MTEFTDVLAEAREITLQRLVAHAPAQGADAIVVLRFDSNTHGRVGRAGRDPSARYGCEARKRHTRRPSVIAA